MYFRVKRYPSNGWQQIFHVGVCSNFVSSQFNRVVFRCKFPPTSEACTRPRPTIWAPIAERSLFAPCSLVSKLLGVPDSIRLSFCSNTNRSWWDGRKQGKYEHIVIRKKVLVEWHLLTDYTSLPIIRGMRCMFPNI